MANPRGTITVDHGGKQHTLELNFGVMADLQETHAEAFKALLAGSPEANFALMVHMVALCLKEADSDMSAETAKALSRKITNEDLVTRLFTSAFPDSVEKSGNVTKPMQAA